MRFMARIQAQMTEERIDYFRATRTATYYDPSAVVTPSTSRGDDETEAFPSDDFTIL